MILPVILCGGSGTRLWPVSRDKYPKQFQALAGEQTLFQQTLARTLHLADVAPPLVMTNSDHRFIAAEQARGGGFTLSGILLEPAARNTAPAIALAAFWAETHADDPLLLVCPADHVILDEAAFRVAVGHAARYATEGLLVTFGIVAKSPETGYGYIKRGAPIDDAGFRVERFVEKPDAATAAGFLADGSYFWNSGMFLFRASRYLDELKIHRPDIHAVCAAAYEAAYGDLDFVRIPAGHFAECPPESIDYAVMEKTADAAVVPVDPGWSDVGAWSAVWEIGSKDDNGNVHDEQVRAIGCRNSFARTHKLTALIGLDNVVVVDTPDALLVADRAAAQDVKRVVELLKQERRVETAFHRKVYRPWGWFDGVDCGERFQVKRIMVKPGATLSLQMHHHRAEHWIVVKGTAKVTCGEKVILLGENESTFIPLGVKHRLENPGRVPLELIEVQSGSYLGEDDIVRFEDTYGREQEG